jgi:hypothetical protein
MKEGSSAAAAAFNASRRTWEYVFIICGEMWPSWAMLVCSGSPFSAIVISAVCLKIVEANSLERRIMVSPASFLLNGRAIGDL